MKHLAFHFDVVSPFAYLAFERLPQALEGLSVEVSYRPLLFAGLLSHWGQKGPAEIEPKRAWTYRHVAWLAHRHGIELQMPAQHPFNPLALLRLAIACAPPLGTPSRHVCEQVLRHVWRGGADANDPARLQALQAALAACHARAHKAEDTDWPRIAGLYDRLRAVTPSPVVELNRAIAHSMAFGPDAGLRLVDEIAGDAALRNYAPLPAARGDFLFRAGRTQEAREHFEAAARLTRNARERTFLLARAAACAS